jgi:hypothetical protein
VISNSWLLLLYGLPTRRSSERVNLWRKLKKFGALQLKTSAYALPDEPGHYERFQWLAEQIRHDGGDATLIHVTEIEGLSSEKIVHLFNDARARDYEDLSKSLRAYLSRHKRKQATSVGAELEKLEQRLKEIREIDYFDCPAAHDAGLLLKQAQGLSAPKTKTVTRLDRKQFVGKTWLTRPRPEIDRVGSAWLIRKFIDPRAKFTFASNPAKQANALPFDMADVEFSHHGDDCTFETLIKRFGIDDDAAQAIAEMIHDADLEDEKFRRPECVGLDRILKGLAKLGRSDEQILGVGFECFDALYIHLKKR